LSKFINQELVESIASELGVSPSFIEKDWYAMQIIASLLPVNELGIKLVFAGGTSLSKGFNLIQRFSEDLDFKVILPEESPTRTQLSNYRKQIVDVVCKNALGWSLNGEPKARNANRNFICEITYQNVFNVAPAIRPYIKLDISFLSPVLPLEQRPLQSFIAQAIFQSPEVFLIDCVSPTETAAEKLSALTWRVLSRDRESQQDDPSLIRHLHDLTLLDKVIENSTIFSDLLFRIMREDIYNDRRGRIQSSWMSEIDFLKQMFHVLESDSLYKKEYEKFVLAMSYARENECPKFQECLNTIRSIITRLENSIVV